MSDSNPTTRFNEVLIIGAGFSGLTMACQLQRKLKHFDYVLYDRGSDMGGTWWANKYPGCAVDIPAALYSLSFAPNPGFSKLFSSQPEVLSYLKKVADQYGVHTHMVYNTEWEGASWDEQTKRWSVTLRHLPSNESFLHECRILISAVGALVNPTPFHVPGTSLFRGPIIHTARWQDVDLQDGRIIVVGNGASAAQLIPAIAPEARSIVQFIRTPQYYIPSHNIDIRDTWRQWCLYVPGVLLVLRLLIFLYLETSSLMFGLDSQSTGMRHRAAEKSKRYVKSVAPEKYWPLLLPSYELGCKRRVFDSQNYMQCLRQEHVSLTDDPIIAVRERSVLTYSGKEFPADVIILATGFSLTQWDTDIRGRNGRSRSDHWTSYGGKEAYNSIAMAGFPNFFYVLGPNSGRGHTSTIFAIESYTTQILRLVAPILEGRWRSVEVKAHKEREYHDKLQAKIKQSIWSGSCSSYFIDSKTGKNWFIYPWSSFRMWYTTRFGSLRDWTYE